MKRTGLATGILLLLHTSLFAQIETDRPEAFLFERKNSLQTANQDKGNTDNADSSGYAQGKVFTSGIEYKTYINANVWGFINSSCITNDFIKHFKYNRTFISDDLKQQEIHRMKSSNRIGTDIKVQLYGSHLIKNTRYEFGLTYRDFYAARFSSDVFKLAFYGNSMFAGRNASLDPLSLNSFNYEAMYAGARKTFGKEKNMTAGVRLGYIRGNRFQNASFKHATLYTDPMGAYVSLNGRFDITYNDDTSALIQKDNGNGLYTDLYFSLKGKRNEFVAEVLDLGFVRYTHMAHYSGDGTYTYNGMPIDNILSGTGFTVNPISMASFLDASGIQKEYKNSTYILPATVHLAYFRHITPKLTLSGGVRQQFVTGYIPRVYAKAAYYIQNNFVIIPTLAYGGFGRADVELGVSKGFNDHLLLSANLFWLEYFAWAKQSSGHGMSLALSYHF